MIKTFWLDSKKLRGVQHLVMDGTRQPLILEVNEVSVEEHSFYDPQNNPMGPFVQNYFEQTDLIGSSFLGPFKTIDDVKKFVHTHWMENLRDQ